MSLAGLVREDFAVHLGSVFTLLGEEGTTMPLTLVEAEPARGGGFAGRAPFALLFRSDVQHVVPQGLYRLEHPVMGLLEIGFGPVAQTEAGIEYEAVFN
ncbi:DUF6916 family protein [Sphingomonas psychrolutea]|uniref:DUF6916 domain-containing protein n=1 Tax=Sphingomonas psychrolutea TaxID=1259676 RepID=A0ABQ1H1T4_9SPHN|nr:hypothetical protein [Sphingomonas psychrolutea]GGA55861.1 hypothetical protein GCM10011395_27840 [Sphingomonas psychrolutea]